VKLAATEVDAGLVMYRFEEWEGLEAGDAVVERGTVKVLANKPRSLVAVWREDYTRVPAARAAASSCCLCGEGEKARIRRSITSR
jgi:hypothetical protein